MRYLRVTAFLAAFLVCGGAGARVREWRVEDWKALCLSMSGIDFEASPGCIQPRELRPDENVALKLDWEPGSPEDYTATGTPRVWVPLAAYQHKSFLFLVDGDPSTSTGDMFKTLGIKYYGYPFYFDFGEPLYIGRIRFYPRQEGKDELGYYKDYYMKGFMIKVSDGFTFRKGRPVWSELVGRPENDESIVDLRFSPRLVRFVKITNMRDDPFELAEVEFYGSGFSLESYYLSRVIDLGRRANFGKVSWEVSRWRRVGEELVEAPDADVSVKVEGRSGLDPTPIVYYAKGDTVEITEEEWKSQPSQRGSKVEDRENWSPWYVLKPGETFPTSGPRRYFQFRIHISGKLTETAKVGDFVLEYSTPLLADRVLGEIFVKGQPRPQGGIAEVVPGREDTFVYCVKANFTSPSQRGFDCIEIETGTKPKFVRLEVGGEEVEPKCIEGQDFLRVEFPEHRIDIRNNVPLKVEFQSSVMTYAKEFRGYVLDTQAQELPQIIEPGDADPDVGTNCLRVNLARNFIGNVLPKFDVSPPIVTPNGDLEGDSLEVSYAVTQMDPLSSARVRIRIYDVTGRLVKEFDEGRRKNGLYEGSWDCRDGEGNLVPPGVYICTISVETQNKTFRRSRSVVVVY